MIQTDPTVIPLHTARRPSDTGPAAADLPTPAPAPRGDCFETLERYWSGLAAGRIMPHRDELDPRAMAGVLDRVFLLERVAPGVARFRLAGQHLNALLDMDLRGMPLTSLFLPKSRDRVQSALIALFDDPARIDMTLDGPRQLMRGRMAARLLALPLRDRDGQVTRAIGCFSAGGARMRAPQRFDVVAETRQTLLGYAELPVPHPTMADATARGPSGHPVQDRPRLRLVVDNTD